MSAIFTSYHQRNLPGGPRSMTPKQDVIYTNIRPIIPKLKPNNTCMPTANYFHAIADASLFLRSFPDAISMLSTRVMSVGGAPLVGFTSILYTAIGLGWAYDSYKEMKACEKIGDIEGANRARVQIVRNLFLSLGSAWLAVLRFFAVVQEVSQLLKDPIVFSTAAMTAQKAASWISGVSFAIFYAINSWRLCKTLIDLSNGSALREKILQSDNLLKAFEEEVDERMYNEGSYTCEELEEIALEEGAAWLEKLEIEAKTRNEKVSWNPDLESRKEYARELFLTHPEWMTGQMGKTVNFDKFSPEGKLVHFGRFMASQRLCAKIENDLERFLGPDVLEAAKKNDPAELKKALEATNWSHWSPQWKTVIKLGLAIVGISALIAGTVLTGGIPLGVLLLLFGVSGIIWIILSDGSLLKSAWESGEIRKRDKFLIYFSMVLSIAAIGGLITLSVMSGGVPLYLASLVLASAWLVANGRAMYSMIDSQRRPWEYQKQPTLKAFRKLTKTEPSAEKIQEILNKMSSFNQDGLREKVNETNNWKKAAKAWKKHVRQLEAESLQLLAI